MRVKVSQPLDEIRTAGGQTGAGNRLGASGKDRYAEAILFRNKRRESQGITQVTEY